MRSQTGDLCGEASKQQAKNGLGLSLLWLKVTSPCFRATRGWRQKGVGGGGSQGWRERHPVNHKALSAAGAGIAKDSQLLLSPGSSQALSLGSPQQRSLSSRAACRMGGRKEGERKGEEGRKERKDNRMNIKDGPLIHSEGCHLDFFDHTLGTQRQRP